MIDLILDKISSNKISSVEVADALGKAGVIPDVKPLNSGKYVAAQVFYVATWSSSNWPLHEQIQDVPKDCIIFVDVFNCESRAVLGDIVAKQLFVYQKISGLVVNGYVRDAHRLIKENYPIWCCGTTPLGCFNKEVPLDNKLINTINQRKEIFNNSIIIGDDSGCTLIENQFMSEKTAMALENIELQEDIWYYCLDTLKMNTYEVICLKKYLQYDNLLPSLLLKKLNQQKFD